MVSRSERRAVPIHRHEPRGASLLDVSEQQPVGARHTYGPDLFLPGAEFNDRSAAAGKWAARVASNLSAWGFNTLGMHNPPMESLRASGVPYHVVELALRVPWGWNMKRSELTAAFRRNPFDVFADAFSDGARSNAERCVKPAARDPRVLGYAYSDGPPWTVDDDAPDALSSLHPWVLALGRVYAEDVTKLSALPYVIGWHHCGYMRGLRPPYAAALRRGDQKTADHHVRTTTTPREGFITELEAPIGHILDPLLRAIAGCDSVHGAPKGDGDARP